MNLSVDYLDNKIVFANEYINAVEIENKRYFYRFVNDLYSVYINGYSDNLKFIQDNKEKIIICIGGLFFCIKQISIF